MWAEHVGPLADAGFRVVAVDLRGFGEAPPPAAVACEWEDVVATLDALGISSASIVGCSFGAAVALRVALVSPERVSALALFGASSPELEPSAELEAIWAAEEEALAAGDVEGAVRAIVDAWTLDDSPAELRERVAAMQRRAFELQADAETTPAVDPLDEDPSAVSRITAPALVVAGARDLSDFTEGATMLARSLPGAGEAIVIEGAGHLVPLEAPERFRELLLDFLPS